VLFALRIICIALVAASMAIAAARAAAEETLHKYLSSPLNDEGSDPDGCLPAVSGLGGPAVWQMQIERLLLDGKALVEMTRQPEPNRFPLCIADQPIAKNSDVELSFVAHDGRIARAAGIVVRFADPQDYYVAEADMLQGNVRLLRVLNGERRELAARRTELAIGVKHSLKVKSVDADFTVAIDGRDQFETRDTGIAAPGRFGIWTRADSVTSFGDLFITVLD
jgi:hypothetical protein